MSETMMEGAAVEEQMAEWEGLSERQQSLAEDLMEHVLEFGMFDQTALADGAHYAPAAVNPFKDAGIKCSNCIFYADTASQCSIVTGTIGPDDVCKLWIIPEDCLMEDGPEDAAETAKSLEVTMEKNYTEQQRRQMARLDQAMPDGSFPIMDAEDLKVAVEKADESSNPKAVRRHIMHRASTLKLNELLPESWNATKSLKTSEAEMTKAAHATGVASLQKNARNTIISTNALDK